MPPWGGLCGSGGRAHLMPPAVCKIEMGAIDMPVHDLNSISAVPFKDLTPELAAFGCSWFYDWDGVGVCCTEFTCIAFEPGGHRRIRRSLPQDDGFAFITKEEFLVLAHKAVATSKAQE